MSTTTASDLHRTVCSGCSENIVLNLLKETCTVKGKTVQMWMEDDDDMLLWDCPSCGYADSFWMDY